MISLSIPQLDRLHNTAHKISPKIRLPQPFLILQSQSARSGPYPTFPTDREDGPRRTNIHGWSAIHPHKLNSIQYFRTTRTQKTIVRNRYHSVQTNFVFAIKNKNKNTKFTFLRCILRKKNQTKQTNVRVEINCAVNNRVRYCKN